MIKQKILAGLMKRGGEWDDQHKDIISAIGMRLPEICNKADPPGGTASDFSGARTLWGLSSTANRGVGSC